MTGLLQRAAGIFVVRDEVAPAVAAVPAAARAVVLGTRDDAGPLAAALALTLRAADRAPAAAVAIWAAAGQRGPATPAASRLAGRLARRDLDAVARGRLAWVRLPTDPDAAVTALRHTAAAVDGPLVTALAGPRPARLEHIVAEHDLVLIAADPTSPLARAAVAARSDECVSVLACRPLRGGIARRLALAGLAAPHLEPPLHAAHTEP
jgi:hypothetical protein